MARKNIENLTPQSKRTKSEQRKIASAGGIASGIARREKKTLRETLEVLLAMPHETEPEKTNLHVVAVAWLKEAQKGNIQAITTLRDTIGEKPNDKLEVSGEGGGPLTVNVVRFSENDG